MRIHLFIACYNDTLFPRTGMAVVNLLERLGHEVVFPLAQTCCGQMHYNTGYHAEAMPLVKRLMDEFRDAETIVVPSASCVAMMRDHYELMAHNANDAKIMDEVKDFLPRVFEFSELITDKLGLTDVGAYFPRCEAASPGGSCPLRMRNRRRPRRYQTGISRRFQCLHVSQGRSDSRN